MSYCSQEMFDPDVLQREYNFDNAEEHRSIDDHLETTAAFQEWATKKAEGMNIDPNMRRPVQVSDFSCFDVLYILLYFRWMDEFIV